MVLLPVTRSDRKDIPTDGDFQCGLAIEGSGAAESGERREAESHADNLVAERRLKEVPLG
jgi:hypothetical protein